MLTIGQLSQSTGVKVPTIRYYEQIGLLPEPERSEANRRLYGKTSLDRLTFVRHSRDLGFSLEAIRELLHLSDNPDHPCEAVDAIAKRQLDQVNARISRLLALREELQRMIAQCSCGTVADCRVIETLGNHALCQGAHAADSHPE
ncbi:MerR family transcriptional regulator [Paracoccus shanxieyensis]|uniref:MerR family DNA-binding protein n=1 Tax=Paracoccus shanxieyensis TaxID=2675752 RepID=A0A6L6J4F6_9RHOB|nr:helix-turn-helix domain-containing protein [Paracoccus shanxieyensis]MTH65604.1 MerR family DNA-binding protein [Paracoccus shanxieyensis]MTH88821.1 MerR family DNA-binding protein [Paracoccus shanxieyensis]